VREDCELFSLLYASVFPFICQFFTDLNCLQSLIDPFVRYRFPSEAVMAVRVQIVPHLVLSSRSRERIFLMYCLGSALSVKAATISVTEKYHSSCSSFHAVRIALFSND